MKQDTPEGQFDRFAKQGDLQALASVFDKYAAELHRVARRLATTTPEVSADDLVQSAFVTAIEKAAEYDPGRPLAAWLVGILGLHAKNASRKRSRRGVPLSLDVEGQSEVELRSTNPSPEDEAASREWLERVRSAVNRVPSSYKPVLEAVLFEGHSPAEAAALLDLQGGTARQRLRRGLTLLRDRLPRILGTAFVTGVAFQRRAPAMRQRLLEKAAAAQPGALLLGSQAVLGSASLVRAGATLAVAAVAITGAVVYLEALESDGTKVEPISDSLTSNSDAAKASPNSPVDEFDEIESLVAARVESPLKTESDTAKLESSGSNDLTIRVLDGYGDLVTGLNFSVDLTLSLGAWRRNRKEPVVNGQVRIADLIPGTRVEAKLLSGAFNNQLWRRAQTSGNAGDRTPLVLDLQTRFFGDTYRGRVLDSGGSPLALTNLRTDFVASGRFGDKTNSLVNLITGSTGEFNVYFDPSQRHSFSQERADRCRLRLSCSDPNGDSWIGWSIELPPRAPQGELELGDIRLTSSPLIAQGIVIDPKGRALSGASIRIELEREWPPRLGPPNEKDLFKGALPCSSGEDGRFVAHGAVPEHDIRVVADLAGYYAPKTEFHQAGSRDLQIVMEPTGSLEGSLKLEGLSSPRKWMVCLSRHGREDDWERQVTHSSQGRWDPSGSGDLANRDLLTGRFWWDNLPPGLYTISVRRGIRGPAAIVVRGVEVKAEEVSRPESLVGLDPSEQLDSIQLTIVDKTGAPVPEGMVHLLDIKRGRVAVSFSEGRATLDIDGSSGRVLVAAPGFRSELIEELSVDRSVTLGPGLEVVVRLPEGLSVVEGTSFSAHFDPVESDIRHSPDYLEAIEFDSSGILRTRLPSTGEWRVNVMMERSSPSIPGRRLGLSVTTNQAPFAVEDQNHPQEFTVEFAPNALEEAALSLEQRLND